MPLVLKGRSYIELYIDGKEAPLEHVTLGRFMYSSGSNMFVPMGDIMFADPHRAFEKFIPLTDGMEMVWRVGPSADRLKEYRTRLFRPVKVQGPSAFLYTLSFIADHTAYMRNVTTKALTGNSSDALAEIARLTNLKADLDTTIDSQTWLPMTERMCQFARRIASYGYIDNKSCMVLAVDFDGRMRYKDIARYKYQAEELPVFAYGAEGNQQGIFVWSRKQVNNSGLTNSIGGYMSTMLDQDITQPSDAVFNKVKHTRIANTLNVNKEVQQSVGGVGRFLNLPIGAGNMHSKATAARHQNRRLRALQSMVLPIMTMTLSDVQVLDPVVFHNYVPHGSSTVRKDEETSGFYIVDSKVVYVSGSQFYVEGYHLVRDGYQKEVSAKAV